MKTVLKRLLSFVLVAMMLVSVMPFQASAAGVSVQVYVADTDYHGVVATVTDTNGDGKITASEAMQAAVNQINTENGGTDYDASKGTLYDSGFNAITEERDLEDGEYKVYFLPQYVLHFTGVDLGISDLKYAEKANVPDVDTWKANCGISNIGFYNVTWPGTIAVGTNNVNITAGACNITIEVWLEGVKTSVSATRTVGYQGKFKLNVADWYSVDDANLYDISKWVITKGDQELGKVDNGEEWTVSTTGDVTARVDITRNSTNRTALMIPDGNGGWQRWKYLYWVDGGTVDYPTQGPSLGTNKSVEKWMTNSDGTGNQLPYGNVPAGGLADTYYAKVIDNSNTGTYELRVHAVYFVDGIEHHRTTTPIFTVEVAKGTNAMGGTVMTDANLQQIRDAIANNRENIGAYTWDEGFYNSSFSTNYTATNLTVNGNTDVYVKVNATKAQTVHLYIHKNTTSKDPAQIISLKGYVDGDKVTLADAKDAAKKADWRGDSYKIYSDDDWKQLMAGGTPSGTAEEVVVDGATIVHILLKNGYKTSGTADNSNYKTGDTIMIAVTALGLSASALVVLYLVNKKKRAL